MHALVVLAETAERQAVKECLSKANQSESRPPTRTVPPLLKLLSRAPSQCCLPLLLHLPTETLCWTAYWGLSNNSGSGCALHGARGNWRLRGCSRYNTNALWGCSRNPKRPPCRRDQGRTGAKTPAWQHAALQGEAGL